MMVRYYNPARASLSHQIDRLFEDFMGLSETPNITTWTPATELMDQGHAFLLNVYLPGVSADDTDVQVMQESISITGHRNAEARSDSDRVLYSDIAYGQFRRLIELPTKVQNTKVEASFENGILSLYLPKVEEAQNKVVKISLGQAAHPLKDANETTDSQNN